MGASFRQDGVTLLELIVALSIVTILTMIAFPAFQHLIVSQRLRNIAFELNAALQYARSEAVTRREIVSVAPTGSDWQNGWNVSAGSLVLQRFSGAGNIAIAGPTLIEFKKNGRAKSGQDTPFVITADPAIEGIDARCIRIDTSGLPKSRVGSSC